MIRKNAKKIKNFAREAVRRRPKSARGPSPPYLLQSANPQPLAILICPFIYINGHAQQRACQSQKHGACSVFLHPHRNPNFFGNKAPIFLHFSATNPLFLPIFHRKNTHSAHKKHTKAGISISFAPTSASAGCISVRDTGAVPQRSKFRQFIRPLAPDIAGIQKQTS